jgi:hypothetical protein
MKMPSFASENHCIFCRMLSEGVFSCAPAEMDMTKKTTTKRFLRIPGFKMESQKYEYSPLILRDG